MYVEGLHGGGDGVMWELLAAFFCGFSVNKSLPRLLQLFFRFYMCPQISSMIESIIKKK